MKTKLVHFLLLPVFAGFMVYLNGRMHREVGEEYLRPVVYRVLVPALANLLTWTGIPQNTAYMIIITASFIGFLLSMKRLCSFWKSNTASWGITYLSSLGLLGLIYVYSKYYDMTTVFLMTLSLILIYKNQHKWIVILFPIMCLNRETSFLVTGLCALWFWRKIKISSWMCMIFYQGFTLITIQGFIMWHYQDLPTFSRFNALHNLSAFMSYWQVTLVYAIILIGILYSIYKQWENLPPYLKISFLSLFIPIFLMYILFGWEFETRVFAEAYPVVALTSMFKIQS